MKRFVALALLFCLCSFSPASVSQTQATKIELLPYGDTDGYQVLSSIIEARTEKLKNGSVSIFHQTISGDALGEIRDCASRFPREFQSALEDFDKRAKTKMLLQQHFSIHKEYKFVETMVAANALLSSKPATRWRQFSPLTHSRLSRRARVRTLISAVRCVSGFASGRATRTLL